MFNAYFFDMDGTLIDTEILWIDAVEEYLSDRGKLGNRRDILDDVYGVAYQDVRVRLTHRHPDVLWDWTELNQRFLALRDSRDVVIPDSVRLLKTLARHHLVAIVSGSSEHDVLTGIERMGVGDDLTFALHDACYSPGKPDPACYLLAAERAGARPEQCLVFEDSSVGVAAAKSAGMRCVALAREDRPAQDLREADQVLGSLADFSIDIF